MKQLFTFLLLAGSFTINAQLKIGAGAHVINSGTLVLDNTSLMNNGSFLNNNGANVIFKGTGSHSISGSGTATFYGLELNKSSDNVLVHSNIKVAGPLKFTKGSLDLTGHSVQLIYPNGLLQNETEQNRIFATGNGVVFIELALNAPNNVNPGNLGFTILSSNNLGTTAIYRGHDRQTKAGGGLSIRRYYNVLPANNSGISVTYSFRYFDAELDGLPESGMKLYKKAVATDWQAVDINGSNTQDNIIDVIGAASLDKYTIFPAAQSPLPLQLLAFNAQCNNNMALLQWITANEVNTKNFTIEKSSDGNNWQPAGVVTAQHNTMQHTYTYPVVFDNAMFYRLKMTDADGSFTYSAVKKLNCDTKRQITVGPNPTAGQLKIVMQMDKKETVLLTVLDARGSLLVSQIVSATEGLNMHTVDLTTKPSGVYLVKLWSANGINETHRIIKY